MNYFAFPSAARRYADGRPNIHPLVMQRVAARLKIEGRVNAALDIGCGTGLSTLALTEIAERVTGMDLAPAMLSFAAKHCRVNYLTGAGEALPFGNGVFDIITISSAFHWMDHDKLLGECRRTLARPGHLIVYQSGFSGRMVENDSFHAWASGAYQQRYPTPARQRTAFTADDAQRHGFSFDAQESLETKVAFSPETLTGYFTTQSNVIAAVEGGGESIESARAWILEQVKPFFQDRPTSAFIFQQTIWYLTPTPD